MLPQDGCTERVASGLFWARPSGNPWHPYVRASCTLQGKTSVIAEGWKVHAPKEMSVQEGYELSLKLYKVPTIEPCSGSKMYQRLVQGDRDVHSEHGN